MVQKWVTKVNIVGTFNWEERQKSSVLTFSGNYINEDIYEAGSPCKSDSDCTANDGSTCNVGTGLCLVAGQTASGASDNNTSSDAGA